MMNSPLCCRAYRGEARQQNGSCPYCQHAFHEHSSVDVACGVPEFNLVGLSPDSIHNCDALVKSHASYSAALNSTTAAPCSAPACQLVLLDQGAIHNCGVIGYRHPSFIESIGAGFKPTQVPCGAAAELLVFPPSSFHACGHLVRNHESYKAALVSKKDPCTSPAISLSGLDPDTLHTCGHLVRRHTCYQNALGIREVPCRAIARSLANQSPLALHTCSHIVAWHLSYKALTEMIPDFNCCEETVLHLECAGWARDMIHFCGFLVGHHSLLKPSHVSKKRSALQMQAQSGFHFSKPLLYANLNFLAVEHCQPSISGLRQCNMIYIRSESVKMLNFLAGIRWGEKIIIQGSPGSGKSLLTWFWICALACGKTDQLSQIPGYFPRSDPILSNKITWIHLTPKSNLVVTVFRNNSVFQNVEFQPSELHVSMFEDDEILVFDGITDQTFETFNCQFSKELKNRRLVLIFVCSAQLAFSAASSETFRVRSHTMYAWKFEEYEAACQFEPFWREICPKLIKPGRLANELATEEEKHHILDEKYVIAGSCSRWMFGLNYLECKVEILFHLDRCGSWLDLVRGSAGSHSSVAVNHLAASTDDISGTFVVSQFAMRFAASRCQVALIKAAATLSANNSSRDGWVVEADFLCQVRLAQRQGFISLSTASNSESIAEKWSIIKIEEGTSLSGPVDFSGTWYVPRDRNQACCDAVLFCTNESGKKTARAINITRAKKHDLKLNHLATFLMNLARTEMNAVCVECVDVVFVHPNNVDPPAVPGSSIIGAAYLQNWNWQPNQVRFATFIRM